MVTSRRLCKRYMQVKLPRSKMLDTHKPRFIYYNSWSGGNRPKITRYPIHSTSEIFNKRRHRETPNHRMQRQTKRTGWHRYMSSRVCRSQVRKVDNVHSLQLERSTVWFYCTSSATPPTIGSRPAVNNRVQRHRVINKRVRPGDINTPQVATTKSVSFRLPVTRS